MKQVNIFTYSYFLIAFLLGAQTAQAQQIHDPEQLFISKAFRLALADSASLMEQELLKEGKQTLTTSESLNQVAATVLNQGYYQEAKSLFRINAQLFPQSKPLGQVLLSIAELDETDAKLKIEHFFNQCFQCMPSSTYLRDFGNQLLNLKKPEKALIAFQLNTMLFPEEAQSWQDYAEALLASQQFDKAAYYYEKVLVMEITDEHKVSASEKLALIERLQSDRQIDREMVGKNSSVKLIGEVTTQGLTLSTYQAWYQKGFDEYAPNETDIVSLSNLNNKDVEVKVFFGSWCGDSKREVPRFMKMAQAAGFNDDQVNLIAVNNDLEAYKQSDKGEEQGLAVFRVPTFVVYEKGKEIGRIIEHPKESLEKDLTTILAGTGYTPSYNGTMVLHQLLQEKGSRYVKKHTNEIALQLKDVVTSRSEVYSYALTKYANKEYDLALAILKINQVLYPDYVGNPLRMGQVYAKLGKTEKAIEYLSIYLDQYPTSTSIRNLIWELKRKKS